MHVLEWFERSEVCAVAGCDCEQFLFRLSLSPPAEISAELTLCTLDRSMPRWLELQRVAILVDWCCNDEYDLSRTLWRVAPFHLIAREPRPSSISISIARFSSPVSHACPKNPLAHRIVLLRITAASFEDVKLAIARGKSVGSVVLASSRASRQPSGHRRRSEAKDIRQVGRFKV